MLLQVGSRALISSGTASSWKTLRQEVLTAWHCPINETQNGSLWRLVYTSGFGFYYESASSPGTRLASVHLPPVQGPALHLYICLQSRYLHCICTLKQTVSSNCDELCSSVSCWKWVRRRWWLSHQTKWVMLSGVADCCVCMYVLCCVCLYVLVWARQLRHADNYRCRLSVSNLLTVVVVVAVVCHRLDWPVRTLSFSYDGHMLASASEDLVIDIADVDTGECCNGVYWSVCLSVRLWVVLLCCLLLQFIAFHPVSVYSVLYGN